jgi:hypothetical protein
MTYKMIFPDGTSFKILSTLPELIEAVLSDSENATSIPESDSPEGKGKGGVPWNRSIQSRQEHQAPIHGSCGNQ